MIEICKFDSKRDMRQTVPDLSCDLRAAIENGVVIDSGTLPEYNEIDDPFKIRSRVRDAFDVVEAHRALLLASKESKSTTTPSAASNLENGGEK